MPPLLSAVHVELSKETFMHLVAAECASCASPLFWQSAAPTRRLHPAAQLQCCPSQLHLLVPAADLLI